MSDHPSPCVCDRCWSAAIDGAVLAGIRARLIASLDEPPPRRKVSRVSRKASKVSAGRRPSRRGVGEDAPTLPDLVQQKDEPPPLVTPTVDEVAAPAPDLVHEVPVPPREPRQRHPFAPTSPPAAKAKRLRAIARFGARLDRRAAAAERAADPIADVGAEEDMVERLERVPEVDDV